jgi:hypothetical protein
MHEFSQAALSSTGADYIMGMGAVKTGLDKASLEAIMKSVQARAPVAVAQP